VAARSIPSFFLFEWLHFFIVNLIDRLTGSFCILRYQSPGAS
jgi:hypothetical protein